MGIGAATMKNIMKIPQKLKIGHEENRIQSKYSTSWHLSEEHRVKKIYAATCSL